MLCLPEYGFPFAINDVSCEAVPKYSWHYDVVLNDFLIRQIRLLEETTGPTARVQINDAVFDVPASWNILMVDLETKLVDTVQITQAASSNYQAFLMHPDVNAYALAPVVLLDLSMQESCVHPMIPRMDMMLHPIGPVATNSSARVQRPDLSYCCLLTPQDLGKYMHGMTAMEVVL